jgi:hypothetical protein
VMNASPDVSNMDVTYNSVSLGSSVAYGTTTGYQSVKSGSQQLQIEPSGSSSDIVNQSISLNSGTDYTVLAANFSSSIDAVVFTDDNSAPSSGNVKIRVINAVPGIGSVDVYVVTPGTDLFSVDATASNVAFESATGYQTEVAGSYEVYFTLPGQKFAFVDSGPFTLSSGQVRTLVGLNGQAGGYTFSILSDVN